MENDRKGSQPIWFANEDIHDADTLYLPAIFIESFLNWSAEIAILPLFLNGRFEIFDRDATSHGTSGQGEWTTLPADAAQRAAREAIVEVSYQRSTTNGWTIAAIPLFRRNSAVLLGVLTYATVFDKSFSEGELQGLALHYRSNFYHCFEGVFVKDLLQQQVRIDRESNRRDALFLAAKRLYDQIDVSSVLNELLHSLEILYPSSQVHLYLSQDYVAGDPRVRPLVFKNTAHDIIAKAFLDGNPATEKDRDDNTRIAIPLSGKQAAYGVLCITMAGGKAQDDLDLPAVLLLADTAGSAFENAKLYEQSNLLINELRLINEMTKRLNQSLRLKEIFQFATSELLTIFDADYCCVLQLNGEKGVFEVKSSNIPSMSSETFSPEYGFCGMVYGTKEPLIISDYWNTRVVSSKLMDNTGSRSLIAAPIFTDGDVVGVILVTHKLQNYFSYENYKLLQVMSTHIGLALTNASLHAEVRRMVITDNLTGLHARHYLDEQIQRRQRKDPYGSLVLVDIDYFKRVNDTYGHQVGDRILVQVSRIISSAIRQDDIAARWGGEELAIYLPGVRTELALRIAERIRKQVAEETDPSVTVSCGISEWTFDQDKVSVESLFYRADMALYEAKNKGRNCIIASSAS
ncbi:sensor domain-containing diguanylate cyclase [Paenibacillus sp. strain BS8-2]